MAKQKLEKILESLQGLPPQEVQSLMKRQALYRKAVALRAISIKDRIDGLGVDIKIARVVNSVSVAVK